MENVRIRSTVFCLLIGGLFIFSAGVSAAEPRFGVLAGLEVAGLSGEPMFDDSDFRFGLNGGMFAVVPASEHVSFRSQIQYVQRGATYEILLTEEFQNVVGHADVTWKLDYIEVPMLLTLQPGGWKNRVPQISIGPYIAFVSLAKINIERDINESDSGSMVFPVEEGEFPIENERAIVLGGQAGVSMYFPLSRWQVLADVRFSLGITDALDYWNSRPRAISLSVGILFP